MHLLFILYFGFLFNKYSALQKKLHFILSLQPLQKKTIILFNYEENYNFAKMKI